MPKMGGGSYIVGGISGGNPHGFGISPDPTADTQATTTRPQHTQATSCIPEVTRDAVNPLTKELVYLCLGNLTQSRRMCSFSSSSNQAMELQQP